MTEKELRTLLDKYDPSAQIKRDGLYALRVFLFSKKKRYPIIAALDKKPSVRVERISEYEPLREDLPVVVISLKRLHLIPKRKKTLGK